MQHVSDELIRVGLLNSAEAEDCLQGLSHAEYNTKVYVCLIMFCKCNNTKVIKAYVIWNQSYQNWIWNERVADFHEGETMASATVQAWGPSAGSKSMCTIPPELSDPKKLKCIDSAILTCTWTGTAIPLPTLCCKHAIRHSWTTHELAVLAQQPRPACWHCTQKERWPAQVRMRWIFFLKVDCGE